MQPRLTLIACVAKVGLGGLIYLPPPPRGWCYRLMAITTPSSLRSWLGTAQSTGDKKMNGRYSSPSLLSD